MRTAEGERWARLARSLWLRLGSEGRTLLGDLECSTAELDKVQGRFAAAGAAFERCHKARSAAHGPDHPTVALALADQASLASIQGEPGVARDLLRQALASLEPVLGPEHPTIARVVSDLGEALMGVGEAAEAETYLQRALAIDTQVFGADHERVGSDHYSLGQLYLGIRPQRGREAAPEPGGGAVRGGAGDGATDADRGAHGSDARVPGARRPRRGAGDGAHEPRAVRGG
jgi:tetratricopeptide (TPR) repeat protein